MSVEQTRRGTQAEGRSSPRWVNPTRWSLWALQRPIRRYVLAVDLAAILLIAATVTLFPITRQHWLWLGALALGSVIHHEAARHIERIRELAAEGAPYVSPKSVWIFAGLLLLPPPLVAALIAFSFCYAWLRVRRVVVHRTVFSAATVVLASAAAAAVLVAMDPAGYPGLPLGPIGLIAIAAAAAVQWLVNYALVVAAVMLSAPTMPARKAAGDLSEQLVEAAALALGAGIAGLMVFQPTLVIALMVPVLAVHRSLLMSQFERAARTDGKTGLFTATFWRQLAERECTRARRLGHSLGILIIDLDRFKSINDTHGHLAGDAVLCEFAAALKSEVRRYDQVGRFGGEEFVVLLPDVSPGELSLVAERIRLRVEHLAVDVDGDQGAATLHGISVSIGGALFPDAAGSLNDALLVADNALFACKNAGRNRVEVVTSSAGGRPITSP